MTYLYVVLAVALRLVPHPWNMTPMGALFLFSGAKFQRKSLSIVVPLIVLIFSDIAVTQLVYAGQYSWVTPFTWCGFVAMGVLGWTLRRNSSPGRVVAVCIGGSLIFFLISNFGVWAQGSLYPRTWQGLIECYIAALPFFRNTVLGNILYAGLMFGSYHLAIRARHWRLQPAHRTG